MKNPTYAKFINEVENMISNLSGEELKKIIVNLAESRSQSDRNEFLLNLKGVNISTEKSDGSPITQDTSPEELIKEIKEYEQRILDGEFFDEEENYRAYEREEQSYWRNDYNDFDEEIDFSYEDYVLEAVELLEKAKDLFRLKDIDSAYDAYKLLFGIFENPEYYEGEEYFIYGFSFKEAVDSDVLKEHKAIFRRCEYLKSKNSEDFEKLYYELCKDKNIMLTDIIEIDRNPLPQLDKFISGLIEYLKDNPMHDPLLTDALFVKGGMEEVKEYGYLNGKKHPSVFLYYYEYAKEKQFEQSELLKLILDGIDIIPDKYEIRANLSLDLIEIAQEKKDKENLLKGYSTAFYSNPSLMNITNFLDFIISENISVEMDKLKNYFCKFEVDKVNSGSYYRTHVHYQQDIYSLETSEIDLRALIIGRYISEGIEPFLDVINPGHFLGFSGEKSYVAIVTSLALKTISQTSPVTVIDKLIDHYCLNITFDNIKMLKKLIAGSSISFPLNNEKSNSTLTTIESLAVKRVSHILKNKLRGGYDSACLLLVACAEAKQLIKKNGNELIHKINIQYKRYSAFRRPLKELTTKSKILDSVK